MTRNKRVAVLVVAAIAIIMVASELFILYSGRQTPSKPATDYGSFVDGLRANGVSVKPAGELPVDFFSVKGRAIIINDQYLVVVFEYPDTASAEAEAARVSPDGRSIGTVKPSWGLTPHFYKSGRLIVLYVGNDENATKALESVLGPQFAGG